MKSKVKSNRKLQDRKPGKVEDLIQHMQFEKYPLVPTKA